MGADPDPDDALIEGGAAHTSESQAAELLALRGIGWSGDLDEMRDGSGARGDL